MHAVQERGDRLIEVPSRSKGQHQWADAIETFAPRTGYSLEDGGTSVSTGVIQQSG